MLETVRLERACIEALDLTGMAQRSMQRQALADRAVALAKTAVVPEAAKRSYRVAHRMAKDNRDILRSAEQAVTTMLNQILGRHSPTYSSRGRTRKIAPGQRTLAGWTG